ncbi:LOW QUALITY PROTEIN: hypothetical protein HID58_025912 [Brassica napus]|uniref:Uncharacterized protein n=1 Tax=Brassica napus TaxID=3708 RepID=A0ABQ8CMF6_BRANA|nr:LOW QUALITY PROTEIN: hypothetical protein HID58_025912 [Brassica napus]
MELTSPSLLRESFYRMRTVEELIRMGLLRFLKNWMRVVLRGWMCVANMKLMRAAVASKQFGHAEIICSLVADACIQICPKNPTNFNVDNVRVAKLLAGGLHNSCIVCGMVLESDAVGSIKRMVAVFAGGVDTTATKTKGTVLIHSAEQISSPGLKIQTAMLHVD